VSLTVHEPTLDDVFLRLTGHTAGASGTEAAEAAEVSPGGKR
jgi:hypothetical protein